MKYTSVKSSGYGELKQNEELVFTFERLNDSDFVANMLNDARTTRIDDIHGMALEIQVLQHHKEDSEAYQVRAMEIYTKQVKLIQALKTALGTCSKKRQELVTERDFANELLFIANMDKVTMNNAILSREQDTIDMYVDLCKIREKNKQLRQQLADALGADETTADSLNMEFRHNPDDDIEVIETNDDKSQCDVCGEYKPNVGIVWADDGGIITACPDCNNGNNPLVQNFDDTESNMPH